jgi:dTDP-4-dehydrorhamnose 3,5-epimerase
VNALPTRLEGPVLLEGRVLRDARGFFLETYREDCLEQMGIRERWVQDNHSRSTIGVVRGLHFQLGRGQAKLVRCARGAVWDVVVDLRRGSPTYAEWEATELSEQNARQLYVPVGFAHGFCVLSPEADVIYKCSTYYAPELERSVAHDDPELGIRWPQGLELALSERDASAPRLSEVADELPWVHPDAA